MRSIRFDGSTLEIDVQGDGFAFARVRFREPTGFRVLDERELCEFWSDYSTRVGWLYEVEHGGWRELESTRPLFGTMLSPTHDKEYFLVDEMCISVITAFPVEIEDLGADPSSASPDA